MEDIAQSLPQLELSHTDIETITELSTKLLETNLAQQMELQLTRDGFPDSRVWGEVQRKEGIRVFKAFQPLKKSMLYGNSAARMRAGASRLDEPGMPSLLMLGTVAGNLNDVMYASVATSSDGMRARSKFVQDGLMKSKVLLCIEGPTRNDPFHTLSVTWRYYSLSEPRDYTCIEATGLVPNVFGDLVGFHLIHSLEFKQLPKFTTSGVDRANMSVCTLFRQKPSTVVDCYTRGYFDFHSTNDTLNNISLHAISFQWLSMARYVDCAQMKKLVWWMQRQAQRHSFASSSQGSSSASSGGITVVPQHNRSRVQADTRCRVCNRGFGGFLHSTPRTCACCADWVCKRCCAKKQVCVVSVHSKSKVYDKKLVFCAQCIAEASKSDASLVFRQELRERCPSYSSARTTKVEKKDTLQVRDECSLLQ
uniref:FYVE-type domain-containing protein n=1 Tax=Hyaloperonospora arabidopsidis (strain Emoy2) TaxID=559515 RepID=M4BWU3_HYAAE